MSKIHVELDDDLVSVLQRLKQPIDQAARELIVLELYRRKVISSGKAAQILGMARFDFVEHASRLGIPFFDMTDEEWDAERKQSELL